MPRLVSHSPSYRLHKRSGQAVVTLAGRDFYLGRFGTRRTSPESWAKYDRLVGEWLAGGRRVLADKSENDVTIDELIDAYWTHAQTYYRRPDGSASDEQCCIKQGLRVLRRLYGETRAIDFGPLAFESVRDAMVRCEWVRTSINKHMGRLRHMFKWAVSKELIPASVYQALATVPGLKAGRSDARESSPVRPVPDDIVERTLPYLSPTVAAMVQIQRLTGARPGEICMMRTCDIDRSGATWLYKPATHKTAILGKEREIPIGPRAQRVLQPFLKLLNAQAYVFSPREAEADRREVRHRERKTPLNAGNAPGTNKKHKPKWAPGDRYTTCTYRQSIQRACERAFQPPPPLGRRDDESVRAWQARLSPEERLQVRKWQRQFLWHPHQLRHTRATEVRRQYGAEKARSLLGHATLSATEIYAERDQQAAREVALATG